MSCDEIILSVNHVSKCFTIYEKPSDRLKQMFFKKKKLYREYWALKDISFNVKKGESVGIIGRNGAGKSTLLQIICGTLTETSGSVRINGRVAALLELGAGFNPEFSGKDNIYLCATLYGMKKDETEACYSDIVAFADIGDFIEQPVKTYSSGMYVRLAFAVIAHVDADILIIDEALAVGDALFTQKCMRFLREFKKTGVLLFVSHDTTAITNLCDKAVWLNKGSLEVFDSAKNVSERYMAYLYGSKVLEKKQVVNETQAEKTYRDCRQDYINHSNLRNDIKILQFKEKKEISDFGQRGATIIEVSMVDDKNRELNWIVGGELVCLKIIVNIESVIQKPIVGFTVKDKLGQPVFGDNTYISTLESQYECVEQDKIQAIFEFQMPILINGEYSLSVAVADGDQDNHIQHHWINDALLFKSTSTSASTGLVGIPMKKIELNII